MNIPNKSFLQSYQYYLFDWDGCLARTLEVWLGAYREIFSNYGIEIDDKTIATEVFGDWKGAEKQGVEDLEGFNDQLMAKVNQDIKSVDLYDGAKDVLTKLNSEGKKIALVTSSVKEFIEPALELHGIKNLFDLILDGNDVEKHKPDPEVISKAIDFFGADKEKTVIVGDSKSDLNAGNAAGIDSYLFYPESHKLFYKKESLLSLSPVFVFKDFITFLKG